MRAATVIAGLAIALVAGCKRPPGHSNSSAAGASGGGAPSSAPSAATQPAVPGPAALTGPVNLIAMSAGTVTREWPVGASARQGGAGVNALVRHEEWQSKSGMNGPYTFVFELAASARVDSLGFQADESDNEAASAAPSVRVESSTDGPDGGYRTVGDYSLIATSAAQHFHLSPPLTTRWLRITIKQRPGDHTVLARFQAYGTLAAPASTPSVAGTWVSTLRNSDLFVAPAKLTLPDSVVTGDAYEIVQIVQRGQEFRGALCHRDQAVDDVVGGVQRGPAVTWAPLSDNINLAPGLVNQEGTLIVGADTNEDNEYVFVRVPAGVDCSHIAPPTGSGHPVLVLTQGGGFDPYPPPSDTALYHGFRFTARPTYVLTPEAVDSAETVVLAYNCALSRRLAAWQARALLDFTQAGHKLIIHDADRCTNTDYSFLPYAFTTADPGRRGAPGHDLILVEANTLGSDVRGTPQYVDLHSWLAGDNELGDANTVLTHDPHWCGHLFGTNVLRVNGFMHMYAPFGRGLIIYNGFDADDGQRQAYAKIALLELQQPVPAPLPCTVHVASRFLIEPSTQVTVAPHRAAEVPVPLRVLANQGYAGTVAVSARAPADAPWKTALSASQVVLKGDVAAENLTISVPATVGPGDSHTFVVAGVDNQGDTAEALVDVQASLASASAVETTTNGCIKDLTVGADAMFAFNQALLTATAQKTLATLGPAIARAGAHPTQINGYTDSVGTDAYNQALSLERARSVRDWLVAHHYVPVATPIQGLGKQNPLAPNTNPDGTDNPAGRARNRRVEVLIDTCK